MMSDWTYREALAELLEEHEGRRDKLYRDHLGNWTIGVGRALNLNPLSDEEIDFLLYQDIKKVEKDLDRLLPGIWRFWDITRRLAIGSMCFQLGGEGLSKFKKTLQALRINEFGMAADEMLDSLWAQQTPVRAKVISEMIRHGKDYDPQN